MVELAQHERGSIPSVLKLNKYNFIKSMPQMPLTAEYEFQASPILELCTSYLLSVHVCSMGHYLPYKIAVTVTEKTVQGLHPGKDSEFREQYCLHSLQSNKISRCYTATQSQLPFLTEHGSLKGDWETVYTLTGDPEK